MKCDRCKQEISGYMYSQMLMNNGKFLTLCVKCEDELNLVVFNFMGDCNGKTADRQTETEA